MRAIHQVHVAAVRSSRQLIAVLNDSGGLATFGCRVVPGVIG